MAHEIASIKLVVSPGDPKTAIEITTLSAGGQDVGYRGVLAAGKQYQARFHCIFSPAAGGPPPGIVDDIFGVGGTEPFYGGKTREEVEGDGQRHYPDPGTGAAPGYKHSTIFDVGGESWGWDLGCRFMANFHNTPDGLLTIQGQLGDLTTQSVVLSIEKGRAKLVKD